MTRLVAIALVIVAALTVFAACGTDTPTPPPVSQRVSPPIPPPKPTVAPTSPKGTVVSAPGLTVELKDNGGLGPFEFDPEDLTFIAGETVNFTFESESQLHTFTVEDLGIDVSVDGGETVGFSFTFDKPGKYDLICIPHEKLGMVGTITVE